MINRSLLLGLTAALYLLGPTGMVHAADSQGNYAVWGLGRTSCHQYKKALAAEQAGAYNNYLMGYLTAFNTLSEDTYDVTGGSNLQKATAWLNGYCDLHQIESFDRAIQQYVSEQFEQRYRVPPGRNPGWGSSTSAK